MKILVLNGPNLNLIGEREVEIYGRDRYADLLRAVRRDARAHRDRVRVYQSNEEGKLVTRIQRARGRFDGIVINAGAYTHTSVALLDALRAVRLPAVEVHLSDPDAREDYRKVSYVREACIDRVVGHGIAGYAMAMEVLRNAKNQRA